jgi:hypothetical protein
MNIDLTPEEAEALREVIANSLKDLPSEIRHTDSRVFRHELRTRREVLLRVSERLRQAPAA